MSRSYVVRHDDKPFTMNELTGWLRQQRGRKVKEWREVFYILAKAQKIPELGVVDIVVTHHRPNRAHLPDCAACYPAAKAALDGLVDAGVLIDDSPAYVKSMTFLEPTVSGKHALELEVIPR